MKTKIFSLTAIALLLTVMSALATQPETVQGEYLEARSVSVYVGACHYGAEYVEGGREATLVWNIHQGTWKGVSLEGLTVDEIKRNRPALFEILAPVITSQ